MAQKSKQKPSKILSYGRQSLGASDKSAVLKSLGNDFLTQGPKVAEFEAALAKYCGAKYCVAVSNGTASLHAAYAAAGIGAGDEGVVPAITFASTANALRFLGADVRFADIDPRTIQVTAQTLAPHITAKTKVLSPVDMTGRPCDMRPIQKLARQNHLAVVVDAAHSVGATYKVDGKTYKVGANAHSDMTSFSFHAVKTITTGEGGAITTNDETLYKKLLRFRTHGMTRNTAEYVHQEWAHLPWYFEMQDLGFNYRITDFQCALGLNQLKKIESFLKRRREIVKMYSKALQGLVGFMASDDANFKSAHHLFPILVAPKKRDEIFLALHAQNIKVQLHYLPVYRQPYYEKLYGDQSKDYPNAEAYFKQALSLPLHPELSDSDVKRVIKTLTELL